MDYHFDSIILSRVGLNEDEARDFIAKHQAYLNSLTPAQYSAVAATLPSWEQAAASIHPDMTAADLQDFVARRGETPAHASALCFFATPPIQET
jgi:hypothetical protein